MAVPKRNTSKSRKRHRRGHQKLPVPASAVCGQCHRRIMPHRVCDYCGFYRGEKILDIKVT